MLMPQMALDTELEDEDALNQMHDTMAFTWMTRPMSWPYKSACHLELHSFEVCVIALQLCHTSL